LPYTRDRGGRVIRERLHIIVGMDSLLGTQLRTRLLRDVRADLPVFKILRDDKCCNIGLLAASKSLLVQGESKEASETYGNMGAE
jgi:hypothetical protein